MINFHFSMRNPFRHKEWKSIWEKDSLIRFWKNKAYNIDIDFYLYNLLELALDLNFTGSDHAGPRLQVRVFGLGFSFGIYDIRHWNSKTNTWEN